MLGQKNEAARGNCYKAALELMILQPRRTEMRLCHGIVRQSQPPHVSMGHAWLEEFHHGIWWVRDGLYPEALLPRAVYYVAGHVGHVVKYAPEEILAHVDRDKHYGPWDPVVGAASHTHDEE
jgi:hypothetical protein